MEFDYSLGVGVIDPEFPEDNLKKRILYDEELEITPSNDDFSDGLDDNF